MKTGGWIKVAMAFSIAAVLSMPQPAVGRQPRGSVREIGRPGQPVDPARHAVPGKVTIVDFFSPYCGPCRQLAPELERLAGARPDLAILSVNVNRPGVRGIDWSSPAVREHGIESLPHLIIYDRAGRKQAEGGDAYRLVVAWLRSLADPSEDSEADTRRPRREIEDEDRAGS